MALPTLAVDRDVDAVLEVRLHPAIGNVCSEAQLEKVHPVDAQAKALDPADRDATGDGVVGITLCPERFDVGDELAGIVDAIAHVVMKAHREADALAIELAQVGRSERHELGAGAATADADIAGAVEQQHADVATEREHVGDSEGSECFDA